MDTYLRDLLLKNGTQSLLNSDYSQALVSFEQILSKDPSDWNVWYLAAQCHRFLGDYPTAISYLNRALKLNDKISSVYHALGVAYQLNRDYAASLVALEKGRDLDPDNELFYISYGLTLKAQGKYEKALFSYQSAKRVLGRRIARSLHNERTNPILPLPNFTFHLWTECAIDGAVHLTVLAGNLDYLAFPDSEMSKQESLMHWYDGLLWVDQNNDEGNLTRQFLPNYINTFFDLLTRDVAYSNIIGNMSTVLDLLGRQEEAKLHYSEAMFFRSFFTNI